VFAVNNTNNGYTLLDRFWDGQVPYRYEQEKLNDRWHQSAYDQRSLGFYSNLPYQYEEEMDRAYNKTLADIVGYTSNVSSGGSSYSGANADRMHGYARFNFTGTRDVGNGYSGQDDAGANRIPSRADPAKVEYVANFEPARAKSWSLQHGLKYMGEIMDKFRTSNSVLENEMPNEEYARFMARCKVASLASAHNVFEYRDPYERQFVPYQIPVQEM
jgi:hypothetical protein